jgi:hypothetical protein
VGAVGHDEVVAEGAFVDGTDGADGGLGALVGGVGLEADAEQVKGFEGVGELEELGFGVDAGAAVRGGEPGVAELGGAVGEVEVEEAGGSDDLLGLGVCGFFDGDPGLGCAGGLLVEGDLHPVAEVGGVAHGVDHVAPDGLVEGDGFERGEMLWGHGFEANAFAFEGGGVHVNRLPHQSARGYNFGKRGVSDGDNGDRAGTG